MYSWQAPWICRGIKTLPLTFWAYWIDSVQLQIESKKREKRNGKQKKQILQKWLGLYHVVYKHIQNDNHNCIISEISIENKALKEFVDGNLDKHDIPIGDEKRPRTNINNQINGINREDNDIDDELQ